MITRFANKDEVSEWNKHILNNPDNGNIFQGYELAEQKKLSGWTPRFVMANSIAITVLEKLVFGLGKIWYIPKGPGVSTIRQLDSILEDLKVFAQSHNVFVIKIEPELIKKDETLTDLLKLGFIRVRPIQPNSSTVTVDISDTLDDIMTHLNQKGRHAIKRAERDGVSVQLVGTTEKNCRAMYDLLSVTAAGAFPIRTYVYYKTFWQRYDKANLGQLFFAYVDGAIVAGAFAMVFGEKSTYKDGASVRERPVYGASHLLQWHVIEWAKSKGSRIHDLCGTPSSDEIKNPDHPYYGIGRFKTSFNKEVTDYVGAYDIIIKPTSYRIWTKIGQRVVLRLHSYRHHENYY
jgi:lipid II:glycine glycyltransferase (peptidoglycan interpeptide bridge formation enzyme)